MTGVGRQSLLDVPMMAFFASRQCPGTAIRAATDWALEQAQTRQVVISGFHSPLEQSVLKILLQARSPVVAVLARPLISAQLPPSWRDAITNSCMAIVTTETKLMRLTSQRALERNDVAARLARATVIAYASADGALSKQVDLWLTRGWHIKKLSAF